MSIGWVFSAAFILLLAGGANALAQTGIPLVDIKSADPTIVVELRYAGSKNVAGHPIYPPGTRALVRPELVPRLKRAQSFLRQFNYRLKIWDAYRPPSAQRTLWSVARNDRYVANPDRAAGSLHSWGVAVDCTLCDLHDRDVEMPTDFDDFTPAALSQYAGPNRKIRSHLHLLQVAMGGTGFYGFRNEWWHFTVKNWAKLIPRDQAERVVRTFGNQLTENL
ncbi:MAG TPA: M15 family metallopeptidase [Chthoniobacterales bacterium]|jgi:D-alanyl-D-alanine dipeptidase